MSSASAPVSTPRAVAQFVQDIWDAVALWIVYFLKTRFRGSRIMSWMPYYSLTYIGKLIYMFYLGDVPPNFNEVLEVPELPSGMVRWFTRAPERTRKDPVLFLLHGGGYAMSAYPDHGYMLQEIYKGINNPRLSIVWIQYTLSAKARFPKPLNEAMAAYRELLKTSDNITLMGDSAGGHLALSMARAAHQQGVRPPTGLALISPWVYLLPDELNPTPSFVHNDRKDILGLDMVRAFGLQTVPLDKEVAAPFMDYAHDAELKKFLPSPEHIFLSYGENEVFRTDIESFIATNAYRQSAAKIYMEPKGPHDSIITRGCGRLRARKNPVVLQIIAWYKHQTEL